MNSKQALVIIKEKIDEHLKNFFVSNSKTISTPQNHLVVDYNSSLSKFILMGGKRLRPALFYYTYVLLNNETSEELLKLSIFFEFIQAFLLIHDDIIDKSELRRGNTTIHKSYQKLAQSKNYTDVKHYGEMIALLIGDISSLYINEIILDSNIPTEKKLELLKLCSKKIKDVLVGQIEDLNLSITNQFSEEDIRQVHKDKTVTYSFELPIEAGIIMADNVSKNKKNALLKFAEYIGYAFQIKDDILGIFGNESKTGKSSYTDLIEGKKTYLIWDSLQVANEDERQTILKTIGKENTDIKQLEKVKSIIQKTGALEKSEKRCADYVELAKKELENIRDENNDGWQFLYGIADFIINRNY
jgi:geranylgeranyl diphosphate synthase type I